MREASNYARLTGLALLGVMAAVAVALNKYPSSMGGLNTFRFLFLL
jgi:hypothetical protein